MWRRLRRCLRRRRGFFSCTFGLHFALVLHRGALSVAGFFVALAVRGGPAGVELPVLLLHVVTVLVTGLRLAASGLVFPSVGRIKSVKQPRPIC